MIIRVYINHEKGIVIVKEREAANISIVMT